MVEEGRASCAEDAGKLRPRVGFAHVDDPNRLDPWSWRFDPIRSRRLAGLDAAPEAAFGGDEKVLVKRIGRYAHLDPLATARDDRERGRAGVGHPHVVLE